MMLRQREDLKFVSTALKAEAAHFWCSNRNQTWSHECRLTVSKMVPGIHLFKFANEVGTCMELHSFSVGISAAFDPAAWPGVGTPNPSKHVPVPAPDLNRWKTGPEIFIFFNRHSYGCQWNELWIL